jgi:prepilin-type N-terminal cleavage/methylation domain-containing protein
MRKRSAFSLIELLVVIGIIAILFSILLPVINKSRSQAYRVKCMSNVRQLLMAEGMYVNDSKGFLTYPNWGETPRVRWTIGWLYTMGQTSTPFQPRDVKTGALYPYLKSIPVYRCPNHSPNSELSNGTDRMTSYIMNGAVSGYGALGNQDASPVRWIPSYKINQFKPDRILLWEAEENGGPAAWNDGASYPSENLLASRHGRGACVGFFDFHVEWMDRVEYLTELQSPTPNRLFCDPERSDGGKSLQ